MPDPATPTPVPVVQPAASTISQEAYSIIAEALSFLPTSYVSDLATAFKADTEPKPPISLLQPLYDMLWAHKGATVAALDLFLLVPSVVAKLQALLPAKKL